MTENEKYPRPTGAQESTREKFRDALNLDPEERRRMLRFVRDGAVRLRVQAGAETVVATVGGGA